MTFFRRFRRRVIAYDFPNMASRFLYSPNEISIAVDPTEGSPRVGWNEPVLYRRCSDLCKRNDPTLPLCILKILVIPSSKDSIFMTAMQGAFRFAAVAVWTGAIAVPAFAQVAVVPMEPRPGARRFDLRLGYAYQANAEKVQQGYSYQFLDG